MIQVELALRDASLAPSKYCGRGLIDFAFSSSEVVELTVPLGKEMHKPARALFRAAFSYYRNYSAHDGARIEGRISARILVIASELLDLLDASPRSLQIEGGPQGLVEHGHFQSEVDFIRFLGFIDHQTYTEELWDGLMESLALAGFSWGQITLVKDLGLVTEREEILDDPQCQWQTAFELTKLGKQVQSRYRKGTVKLNPDMAEQPHERDHGKPQNDLR